MTYDEAARILRLYPLKVRAASFDTGNLVMIYLLAPLATLGMGYG